LETSFDKKEIEKKTFTMPEFAYPLGEYFTAELDQEWAAVCANATDNLDCRLLDYMVQERAESMAARDDLIVGVDTFFLLFSGALVFFMQAGFAMLCAGSVRVKNVKNIMLKNLLDACGGALGFWSFGWCFAYGTTENTGEGTTLIGWGNIFLSGFEPAELHQWFFQFAFAATAATIVAGTVAERCKMSAYLCYSFVLTAFIYPVVVHQIWDSHGFLSAFNPDPMLGVGMVDFAGSGVVHLTGGATALVAAIILGPRKGRFYDDDGNVLETPANFQGHSTALAMLGTFVLWFGWYGFNPGSALAIGNAESAATAALCAATTTIAAAAGCVTCMFTDTFLEYKKTGEVSYDLTMAMNGCLAGLVAITSGTSVVMPWAAFVIGVVGGLVYLGFSKLLIKLKIDDAVDAIPVHFANGIWGVIAAGLFAHEDLMVVAGYQQKKGLFYGEGSVIACQIIGILFILVWVMVPMGAFFYFLKVMGIFRVDALEEEVGLDISHHHGAAYDMSGPKKEDVEELMEVRASRHGKVEVPDEKA